MVRLLRALLVALIALSGVLLLRPASPASAAPVQPAYDWYRYQGASDSGPKASINCEVTSVAMSVQYARNNLRVPITRVREVMGTDGLTSSGHAEKALAYWEVPQRPVQTVQEIIASLDRGHIVVVGLMMNRISPGADYQKGSSSPSQRFGRYNPYDGAHSVVVKGVTEDKGWFIVYDPNVWDGSPVYWYSDGTPKGKDRYYPVGEVAKGMADLADSPKGLEILVTLPQDAAARSVPQAAPSILPVRDTATPTSPPTVREFPKQVGDLAAVSSSGSAWKSATFIFRIRNLRNEPFPITQVAVQGRSPSGREFVAASSPLAIPPGSEGAMGIPMAVNEPGTWRVYRVLYYAEGQWRLLEPAGYRQQAEFVIQ